ncbi:hypothetical protein EW026_g3524 [Hermanssonia centrifuga]|uniref:Uncharacterized protein n=1 Tax=Hermanssonia centrifuga TaxID=98765 RepID=A0A4S4KJX3_9APHY|nr:hypothetical protein EW026_g3524 [Hermanssonia centrifuga]
MGAAVSAMRESITGDDDNKKQAVKQQLDFLVNTANTKLDQWQAQMDAAFTDKTSVSKRQVPGIRALRWERGYRVGVTKEAASDENYHEYVESGVHTALDVILGNTHAGEQCEEKSFVCMKNNAIIRIDTRIWRYNFEGTSVMANSENVFCYIFCLSVVDHRELNIDELVYLVSEYSGDTKATQVYADELTVLWNKLTTLNPGTGLVAPDPAMSRPTTPAVAHTPLPAIEVGSSY